MSLVGRSVGALLRPAHDQNAMHSNQDEMT
jgi:hypothetical protein